MQKLKWNWEDWAFLAAIVLVGACLFLAIVDYPQPVYSSGIVPAPRPQLILFPVNLFGGQGCTNNASTTGFNDLGCSNGNVLTESAFLKLQFNVAGTLKNFALTTQSAQSGTGSYVLTVRKNGADTALVVTIPAGTAANTLLSDTTDSVAVTVGDLLSLKGVNSANVGSAAIFTVSYTFTPN